MKANPACNQFAEAFRSSKDVIMERQVILSLAYSETDRKYYNIRYDIRKMNEKLANAQSDAEIKACNAEIIYLQQCLDGWQQTLDHIAIWQKELDNLRK